MFVGAVSSYVTKNSLFACVFLGVGDDEEDPEQVGEE